MDRPLPVAALLVAALLVLLVPYPATFSTLSDQSERIEYHVDPAGSVAYQDRLDATGEDANASERDRRRLPRSPR